MYYEKDPKFYLTILQEEEQAEAGHEFKLQLFKQTNFKSLEESGEPAFGYDDFDKMIAATLIDYDISNFKSQTHYPAESFDKHRILFTIKDKEKAIKFWQDYVIDKKRYFQGCRHIVYLQKPDEVFVRYGD